MGKGVIRSDQKKSVDVRVLVCVYQLSSFYKVHFKERVCKVVVSRCFVSPSVSCSDVGIYYFMLKNKITICHQFRGLQNHCK